MDNRSPSRREALKAGAAIGLGTALAGCTLPVSSDNDDGPLFTEGDHDDGTAWATTELSPGDAEAFDATFEAWSESESFNTLRNVVASLGAEAPTAEAEFPDPGQNSSNVDGAPYGGFREPLHLAEGWREYGFTWEPASVPETLYLSLGVSVVWEADATHYLDSVRVESL